MSTTERAYPGGVVSDASDGGVPWSSPEKAATDNDDNASCVLSTISPDSERMTATQFAWPTMQSEDTLISLKAGVNRKASVASSIHDLDLRMIIEGTVSGDDMHDESTLYPVDETPAEYDVLDLSNLEITCAQLKQATTGFYLRCQNLSVAGARTAFIDVLWLEASFEPAAPSRPRMLTLMGAG